MFESLVVIFILVYSELGLREVHPDKFSGLMCSQNIVSLIFLSKYKSSFLNFGVFTTKLINNLRVGHLLFSFDPLVLCMFFIELGVKEHLVEMIKRGEVVLV